MAEKKKKVDPCTITLKDVRLSFADAIFAPKKPKPDKDGKQGDPKYHTNALMPKTGHESTPTNLALWRKARDAAMEKEFGADKAKWPKIKDDRKCVRDGDQEDWEGYENQWYISAGAPEDRPPKLVHRDPHVEVKKSDGLLYSGAWVNLRVNIWAQNNEHGKRINATLLAIQFVRKDEAFGAAGPIDIDEAFEDISEDGDVGEMDDDGNDEDTGI